MENKLTVVDTQNLSAQEMADIDKQVDALIVRQKIRQCQEFCVIRIVDLTPFFQRKIFRVP